VALNPRSQQATPDQIPVLLSCIYDSAKLRRSSARKEGVRLFAFMAIVFERHFVPYLHRVVQNIIKRFKDPETSVLEACAETLGSIASLCGALIGGGGADTALYVDQTFVTPLLAIIDQKEKNLVQGASMALAKVGACERPTSDTLRLMHCIHINNALASHLLYFCIHLRGSLRH
jgi:hypothetical protein